MGGVHEGHMIMGLSMAGYVLGEFVASTVICWSDGIRIPLITYLLI
jgi:hypothetical protein